MNAVNRPGSFACSAARIVSCHAERYELLSGEYSSAFGNLFCEKLSHRCLSESKNTLNEPGHGQAADEVGRDERCPRWQRQTRETHAGCERQHGCNEQKLPRLDAEVEEEQGDRDMPGWHADFAQRPREAEAVQESKCEGHDPRRSRGDAWLSRARIEDLDCEERD